MNTNIKLTKNSNLTKVVLAEYRLLFTADNVLVKIPSANSKYLRFDQKHKLKIDDQIIYIPEHYVHGFIFPGTNLIMYRHFYVSKEFLGKTINAQINLYKKVYFDGKVQFILDVKPQLSSDSKYELKIITFAPKKNQDLGSLICLNGQAIGKIACREIKK